MIDLLTEEALRLWGRWASVRPIEPSGHCYSLEGRWVAPSDAGEDVRQSRMRRPGMSAYDHEQARFAELIILTLRRPEIGSLCVVYAGMSVRRAVKLYGIRSQSVDRVLIHAQWKFQNRLQAARRQSIVLADLAAQVRSDASPSGGRVVPETLSLAS